MQLADDIRVLLSVFLSRPQNLLAVGHPVRNGQKSIQNLLALGTGLEVVGWWRCPCEFWWVAKVQIGTGCWTLKRPNKGWLPSSRLAGNSGAMLDGNDAPSPQEGLEQQGKE